MDFVDEKRNYSVLQLSSYLATEEGSSDKNLSLPPNKKIAKAMFEGGLREKTKTRILEIIHYIEEDWFFLNELFEISGLKSKSSFTHTIIDRLLEVAIIRF